MVLQITIFDHRGCARVGKEYLGEKSNTQDDEMMVKVASVKISYNEAEATRKLQEFISLKEKGIDGTMEANPAHSDS